MSKHVLHRDYETRSPVDLKKAGAYVYFEHPDTDVWCLSYAVDDGEIKLWLPGDPVPPEFVECAANDDWLAEAHNNSFERLCERYIMGPRYGFPIIPLERQRCTLAKAYAMALPGSLEHVVAALGVDAPKDMEGRRIMLALSRPRRPRKGEDPTRVYWRDEPDKLARLYSYNKQDIAAERGAGSRLVALRPSEQKLFELDSRVNDRGVFVDVDLAKRALAIVEHQETLLDREMAKVTDYEVTACTNLNQLKVWLKARGVALGEKLDKKTMTYVDTLDKAFVEEMLARHELDPAVRRALELRQEAGKASVAKINALLQGTSRDGRARGLLAFHAANTGRWAGRRFQPQNLKRYDPDKFDFDGAIDTILRYPTQKAVDTLDAMFDAPMACLSYILRGLIKAPPGKKIVAADFSNVEGRVLAWLAGERKKIEAFRAYDSGEGPDLYKVMAGHILNKAPADVTKLERQNYGKVPELACGFGGGVGAFQVMAHAYNIDMPDEEADEIKKGWRDNNPAIVSFWYDLEEAALKAIASPGQIAICGKIKFKVVGSFLWCQIPSGRALCYPFPAIRQVTTPWGAVKDAVTFKTVVNVSNARKIVSDPSNTSRWARISTYGGGLAENVTQAVARDLLAEAMVRLEANGYPIILTCHDENVSEVDENFGSAREYEEIMCELPSWAKGLPVAASGFEAERYRK